MADSGQSREGNACAGAGTPTQPEKTPSGNDHGTSKTRARLIIIAIMLAIGAGVFFWARSLLPSGQAITTLSSYDLNIQEAGTAQGKSTVSLNLGRQPDGAIDIQYKVATGYASTKPGQESVVETTLDLYGPDLKVMQCQGGPVCSPGDSPESDQIMIKFSAPSNGEQVQSVVVSDPTLGFSYDNESAVAEMPYVSLESIPLNTTGPSGPSSPPNSMPLSLQFGFDIPNANNYDWSLPPLNVSSTGATWEETIDPANGNGLPAQQETLSGGTQAAELTGSDHIAQTTDNQDIFASGVLFGVAAAAGLAAILEFLYLVFKVE